MQDGQKPRPLHEKPTTESWPHAPQRTRDESVGQNTTVEIPLELLPHVGRQPLAAAAMGGQLEERRQVLLHHPVEDRLLRPPPPVLRHLHDETTARSVPGEPFPSEA